MSRDLRIKWALFLAIPVNTALCGCECWAMTDKLHDRLSAFHHKALPLGLCLAVCGFRSPQLLQKPSMCIFESFPFAALCALLKRDRDEGEERRIPTGRRQQQESIYYYRANMSSDNTVDGSVGTSPDPADDELIQQARNEAAHCGSKAFLLAGTIYQRNGKTMANSRSAFLKREVRPGQISQQSGNRTRILSKRCSSGSMARHQT